mmetsp:Transcript_20276/g.24582  ORF Transcript_20276/g.24582 Transcript_20276/m.24582 type:complete len:210 (-) Transcript_20276:861-1490(-)
MVGFVSKMFALSMGLVFAVAQAKVLVLDEDNFEHLTQASSGATTGHHFVKFYAPWCGHCKKLEPTWEALDKELEELNDLAVVIGKVDATKNANLAKLYEVKGYPTLLMFSQGKLISYKGPRDLPSLLEFCRGGFKEEGKYDKRDVPKPKSFIEKELETVIADLDNLWRFKKAALGVTFTLGIFIGTFLGGFCCARCSQPQQNNNKLKSS